MSQPLGPRRGSDRGRGSGGGGRGGEGQQSQQRGGGGGRGGEGQRGGGQQSQQRGGGGGRGGEGQRGGGQQRGGGGGGQQAGGQHGVGGGGQHGGGQHGSGGGSQHGGGQHGSGGGGQYGAQHRGGGGGGDGRGRGGGGGFDRGAGRGFDRGAGRGSDRGAGRGGYDHGGGRGFDRRGGGGGGKGGSVTESKEILPLPVGIADLKLGRYGWLNKDVPTEELKPPSSLLPGTLKEREISITLNHAETRIALPKVVFQYDVDIDLSDASKNAKKSRKKRKEAGEVAGGGGQPQRGGRGAGRGGRGGRGRGGGGGGQTEAGAAGGRGGEPGGLGGRDPPKPKLWKRIVKSIIPILERQHEQHGQPIKIASDGLKAMYTTKELAMTLNNSRSYEFEVPLRTLADETSDDVYVVTITMVAEIATSVLQQYISNMKKYVYDIGEPENAVKLSQIYNIVLKTSPMFNFIPVGRASFFPTPSGDGFPLGGGLVNWSGFSLIFNFGWKPFINVDVANSAFLLGKSVYEVLREVLALPPWDRRQGAKPEDCRSWGLEDIKKAENLLRSCMVSYEWPMTGEKFKKRVGAVLCEPPREHRFTGPDGETNVAEYCLNKKRYQIKYPDGICLRLGSAIVPAEVCRIEKGQVFSQKLEEAQTAAMIKDTAKNPADRLVAINESIKKTKFQQDPVLKEFGVTVRDQLLTLSARVLPRPTLVYGSEIPGEQKRVVPAQDGTWSSFEKNMNFLVPFAYNPLKWSLSVIGRDFNGDEIKRFVDAIIRTGRKVGLNFGTVDDVVNSSSGNPIGDREPGLTKGLHDDFSYFQKNGYKMVLVITPRKDTRIYAAIKQTAEIKLANGILTQCVQTKNVQQCKPATVENIILKINTKLGGINYLLHMSDAYKNIDILKAPAIVVGADVTHPAPGSNMPSMAAVTASTDRTGMPFMMHTQAQRKAQAGAAEIIDKLDVVMVKFLTEFIKRTGHKPRKIIFYRDGVGDSQFAEVLQKEMMQIRSACKTIGQNAKIMNMAQKDLALGDRETPYEPKITFVAVQKRHKTRFFVQNERDGVGGPCNAPPGTVVDTQIVSPAAIDFYLLSHLGIQGTSKPTRYQVLWDDSNFSSDELELLSYFLCFMYVRCTRSVSYPAPTYYAHLAATRAKIHIYGLPDSKLEDVEAVNKSIQRQGVVIDEFPMHFV